MFRLLENYVKWTLIYSFLKMDYLLTTWTISREPTVWGGRMNDMMHVRGHYRCLCFSAEKSWWKKERGFSLLFLSHTHSRFLPKLIIAVRVGTQILYSTLHKNKQFDKLCKSYSSRSFFELGFVKKGEKFTACFMIIKHI